MNYLLGGAQYVLANLWDVTDKDIDKLSMECMRMFFDGTAASSVTSSTVQCDKVLGPEVMLKSTQQPFLLAQALTTSRNVCKLKNAVGCAPVMYGIPKMFVQHLVE